MAEETKADAGQVVVDGQPEVDPPANVVEKKMASSPSPVDYSDEKTIFEIWPSLQQDNKINRLAARLPLGLGILIYFPAYLFRVLNIWSAPRFTLTNRRLRLDRGVQRDTVDFVTLEEIDDVRVADSIAFTRTGDLEVISKGVVRMRMGGIQDPLPARQTILDAVRSRKLVQEVLQRQRSMQQGEVPPRTGQ